MTRNLTIILMVFSRASFIADIWRSLCPFCSHSFYIVVYSTYSFSSWIWNSSWRSNRKSARSQPMTAAADILTQSQRWIETAGQVSSFSFRSFVIRFHSQSTAIQSNSFHIHLSIWSREDDSVLWRSTPSQDYRRSYSSLTRPHWWMITF